jgi:hypothetical protein
VPKVLLHGGPGPLTDAAGMAKKPGAPTPPSWDVYKVAKRAVWLGAVAAPEEAAAIEKGAAEFKVSPR